VDGGIGSHHAAEAIGITPSEIHFGDRAIANALDRMSVVDEDQPVPLEARSGSGHGSSRGTLRGRHRLEATVQLLSWLSTSRCRHFAWERMTGIDPH
jgi:hypothetical protein